MMGWPNNYVQGVYNSDNELVGVDDGAGGQIGLTPTYTWATKPLASAYTGRAFISDIGGGSIWISNGTRWYPENGRVVLYNISTPKISTFNGQAIAAQYLLQGGVWQDRDIIEISSTYTKNGTLSSATHQFKIGSAGLIGDQNIDGCSTTVPGLTNLTTSGTNRILRINNTTVKRMNSGWNGTGTSTAPVALDQTVSSLDSDVYLTYTSSAGGTIGDTFTLYEFMITLVTAV